MEGLEPEQLGLSVSSDDLSPTLLSFWIVESAVANGERRTTIQTIAVQPDGTRMPAVERQSGQYLNAPLAKPFLTAEERVEFFRQCGRANAPARAQTQGIGDRRFQLFGRADRLCGNFRRAVPAQLNTAWAHFIQAAPKPSRGTPRSAHQPGGAQPAASQAYEQSSRRL